MNFLKEAKFVNFAAGAILFTLVAALLRDALFTGEELFLGSERDDMHHLFIQWMHFGFSSLKEGVFPLWNPFNPLSAHELIYFSPHYNCTI
jgi:hypothetical protein